ncbi:MAG TPA: WbqC family protein [Bacteroidales bacterium]|nr:WbqC family protein [Bacteroidales bacterium]
MQLVLPTAYFPPVSWMALFLVSSAPLLEIHETFPKQTIRNRCHILAANGKLRLTVPLKKPNGNKTKTSEVAVDNSQSWQEQHFRSVASAYRNAPYFMHYEEELHDFFEVRHLSLIALSSDSLELILKMLRTEKSWNYTVSFDKQIAGGAVMLDFQSEIDRLDADFPVYMQTFSERHGFVPDLSVADLIFNCGPKDSLKYLEQVGRGLIKQIMPYSG